MTGDQLLLLARIYGARTQTSLRHLGRLALNGNHKFFARLEQGSGVNTTSIDRAALWFAENWPQGLPWPEGVPDPPCRCGGNRRSPEPKPSLDRAGRGM